MLTFRRGTPLCLVILLVTFLLLHSATTIVAAPPPPLVSRLEQADGTVFEAQAFGDEWYSGVETVTGYTILFDEVSRNWVYAKGEPDGSLSMSSLVVGVDPPLGIPKHLRPAPELMSSHRPAFLTRPARAGGANNVGEQPMLVLLASFQDRGPVGTTASDWAQKIFGSSNSVAHYYREVSYDNFRFTPAPETHGTPNDGIVGWLPMSYIHPNSGWMPGFADRKLLSDSILAADPYVDFAAFDDDGNGSLSRDELHLVLVAAGYEAGYYGAGAPACTPSLRGTAWGLFDPLLIPVVDGVRVAAWYDGGGYTQFGEWHCHAHDQPGHAATLGIMVHEIGHDLDWPDLYDTDYTSYGVGYWSVMSYGMWLSTGPYLGDRPSHPDAWSKWYQGWLAPIRVTSLMQTVAIQPIASSPSVYQLLYNLGGVDWDFYDHSGIGEYFLVENRQKTGYDAALPGTGLLVWHIDETRPFDNTANNVETRKLVDLEEADGRDDLDDRLNAGDSSDPYPGSGGNQTFDDTSTPNSRLYSGSASEVSISNIVDNGGVITADLYAPMGMEKLMYLPLVVRHSP